MEITGILHCHSHYSYDAKMSLQELKDLFKKNGISFVCMTEHTDELTRERAADFVKECDRLSDETFRFIPGFEVPYFSEKTNTHAHVLMIGCRTFHMPYARNIEALREWTKDAAFIVLAHPVRNQFAVDDGLLGEIDGLEVWNQQYEGKRVPRTRSLRLFDEIKKKKESLVAVGGIDFHRKEHYSAPLVHMNVEMSDETHILEKLKTGAFTVTSSAALIYGSLPNAEEIIKKYRWQSSLSVLVITIGKGVNKALAALGLSLPRSLKQAVREKI